MSRAIPTMSLMFAVCLVNAGCEQDSKEVKLQDFITSHVAKMAHLQKESRLAKWAAATVGGSEDYQLVSELKLQIRQIYSDSEDFAFLDEIRKSGQISDPVLKRQVES